MYPATDTRIVRGGLSRAVALTPPSAVMFAVTGMNAPVVAGFQTVASVFFPEVDRTSCDGAIDCAGRSGRDAICAATNPRLILPTSLCWLCFMTRVY
jgi:hypothetical protein